MEKANPSQHTLRTSILVHCRHSTSELFCEISNNSMQSDKLADLVPPSSAPLTDPIVDDATSIGMMPVPKLPMMRDANVWDQTQASKETEHQGEDVRCPQTTLLNDCIRLTTMTEYMTYHIDCIQSTCHSDTSLYHSDSIGHSATTASNLPQLLHRTYHSCCMHQTYHSNCSRLYDNDFVGLTTPTAEGLL